MLTDIFAERYSSRVIWGTFTETESKLIVQCIRMVNEQLFPYWIDGKKYEPSERAWKKLHDDLSMELGLKELAPRYYFYQTTWAGKPHDMTQEKPWNNVCEDFVCAKYNPTVSADRFMKERISFIELAFRRRAEHIALRAHQLEQQIFQARVHEKLTETVTNTGRGLRLPGKASDGFTAQREALLKQFTDSVSELNERFRRASAPLNYHNGFIQIATDQLLEENVEKPFWQLVADPIWKNVDTEMKEALDQRDAGVGDPALAAACALESAIKIISEQKGWTHGAEKGAHAFIDNLGSKANGNFISDWERDALKAFFSQIRNPLGHGPGSAPMPQLTDKQTDWAIETCMSWVKSLIRRL